MTMYDTLLFPHAQIKRLIIDSGIERVSNDAVGTTRQNCEI